jgi:hypothetical protein
MAPLAAASIVNFLFLDERLLRGRRGCVCSSVLPAMIDGLLLV